MNYGVLSDFKLGISVSDSGKRALFFGCSKAVGSRPFRRWVAAFRRRYREACVLTGNRVPALRARSRASESVPLLALPAAGLLAAASYVGSGQTAYVAVAGLARSVSGLVELTGGCLLGRRRWTGRAAATPMVVTSIMNTGGTMGGIIGIPIVAYLSGGTITGNAAFPSSAAVLAVMSSSRLVRDRFARREPADPDDTRALNSCVGGRSPPSALRSNFSSNKE